ncbi:MAG: cyclic nucleotide-binding domain-containing protein [Deltaproteobacteria bacterium]|nr:cyclic nucleotide-binding domain-containing protein [Deltaproteobacteria bacterium]
MIVQEINLFKGLDFGVVKQIAEICIDGAFIKGKVLFRINEKADSLYILRKGSVNLVIDESIDMIYKLSQPGEVIGWSSMVENGIYTASAVCDVDSELFRIDKEKLNRIFNKHPDFGLAVLRRIGNVFASRLTNAYQEIQVRSREKVA